MKAADRRDANMEEITTTAAEDDYILLGRCDPATMRPCEILITYAQLAAMAVQAGTDASAVTDAVARQALTEREARAAAEQLVRQLPPDQRLAATDWVRACWGEEAKSDG